jgi:hypothetical protein
MVAHSCLYLEIIVRTCFINCSYHSFCWKSESKTVHRGAGVRSVSCQRGTVDYQEGAPIRRRRHGLRPRWSGPRRFDAGRRAVRKLRGRTDPSRAFGGIKEATTRLTACPRTGSSNPVPSSGESTANHRFLGGRGRGQCADLLLPAPRRHRH